MVKKSPFFAKVLNIFFGMSLMFILSGCDRPNFSGIVSTGQRQKYISDEINNSQRAKNITEALGQLFSNEASLSHIITVDLWNGVN